mgnify:CR=1 FL=1
MDLKIKEFEKAAIEAASGLRNELGATRINIEIHVDKYEKGCKTDVTFFMSKPMDATKNRPANSGPVC